MTSRERILKTLANEGPDRAPRQLWLLPWAVNTYPAELDCIRKDFPDDIISVGCRVKQSPLEKGDLFEVGEYTDAYGCKFVNIQRGIQGECKEPLVQDEDWADCEKVHIPYEWLEFDIQEVNENIEKFAKDKFTMAGHCARPFEQLQFIRGTENLFIDFITRPPKMMEFIKKLHAFYCELLEKWATSNVDSLVFMDDWGSQTSLLIDPKMWREIFKPLYKDYIDIAHRAGKKIFMHSDGYILSVIPDLIELGLDALNCQLFCMGFENLSQFRGKITFWGEIDRQHILPYGSSEDVREAVRAVYDALWANGGCIAECEFGWGAKPENVRTVFETWDKISKRG